MSSSLQRGRARLSVHIPDRKDVDFERQSPSLLGGTLSPDLQPATPPTYPTAQCLSPEQALPSAKQIGRYILVNQLDCVGDIQVYRAFHCDSQEEYVCKVLPLAAYRDTLAAYWAVGSHNHINAVEEIVLGRTQAYVLFPRHYGDLHSYVRRRRRLREPEAARLFRQIMAAISHCHESGVVLRDLKLRKFVFKNPQKTELMLESLEDGVVLEDEDDDSLADKHGCPAYVSPEILTTTATNVGVTGGNSSALPLPGYSGRAADVWSAGVMLYTLLVGRYPFHDAEPSALFSKIRRGLYHVPESVSPRARCLIRSLLRQRPEDRLTAPQALTHPWFRPASATGPVGSGAVSSTSASAGHRSGSTKSGSAAVAATEDQAVPDCGFSAGGAGTVRVLAPAELDSASSSNASSQQEDSGFLAGIL